MSRRRIVFVGMLAAALGAGGCGSSGSKPGGVAGSGGGPGAGAASGGSGGDVTGAGGDGGPGADAAAGTSPDGAPDDGAAGAFVGDGGPAPTQLPPDPVVVPPPPPYKGRIVVSPAAVLLTKAGDTATLTAQAFDALGAPMAGTTFVFSTSRSSDVTVDAAGHVTATTSLGSAQITATGGGLTSPPILVLVAQPPAGAVLVSDAQIVNDMTLVDPTVDPVPGSPWKATLAGTGALAPGTVIMAREGKSLEGKVVSATPNGTAGQLDVVVTLLSLFDLFSRLHLDASYGIDAQTVVDADALAALASHSTPGGPLPPGIGVRRSAIDVGNAFSLPPFTCQVTIDPAGVSLDSSLSFAPAYTVTPRFIKDADDNWEEATVTVKGSMKTTGKAVVSIKAGGVAGLSCKYKWKDIIPPVAGPLSAIVAPRIALGARADIKGAAIIAQTQFGAKVSQESSFEEGLSWTRAGGFAAIVNGSLPGPTTEPIMSSLKEPLGTAVEISFAIGGYADLNVTAADFGLASAFVGAKVKYQSADIATQLGLPMFSNKYEVRAPVGEIGPGSSINKALSLFGGNISVGAKITQDGLVVARSPFGTLKADRTESSPGQPITFTVMLDPSALQLSGLPNVSGVHIYRVRDGDQPMMMIPEVATLSGAGPVYLWKWTPTDADLQHSFVFWASVDDVFSKLLAPGYSPFEVADDSAVNIHIGPNKDGWAGTTTLSWAGSGTTSSGRGTWTSQGGQMIAYEPGMPSFDGVGFDMSPTEVYMQAEYDSTEPPYFSGAKDTNGCLTGFTDQYHADGIYTEVVTGETEGILMLLPTGDYEFGIPGLSVNADFTDLGTIVESGGDQCTASKTTVGTGSRLLGSDPGPIMGKYKTSDTTLDGAVDYSSPDGTTAYHGEWHFHRVTPSP